jgi:hypothetical protein
VGIFQAIDLEFFVDVKRIKQTTAGEFSYAFGGEPITKVLQAGEQMAT